MILLFNQTVLSYFFPLGSTHGCRPTVVVYYGGFLPHERNRKISYFLSKWSNATSEYINDIGCFYACFGGISSVCFSEKQE